MKESTAIIRRGLKCPLCGKSGFRNEFDINLHGIETHGRPVMDPNCKEARDLREAYSRSNKNPSKQVITLSKKKDEDGYMPPRMSEKSSRGIHKRENRD